MNMEERLQAVVSQAQTDGVKWHTIIHGLDTESVETENGNVPTLAKQMKDVHDEVVNGVIDYMTACETARDITLQAKTDTLTIKNETESIKSQTLTLKNQTATLKNQAQSTFNNIENAVSDGVSILQNESQTQVGVLQTAVASEVARAETAANTAEQATSSKLNIDCSNINLTNLLSGMGVRSNNSSNVLKFPVLLENNTIRLIIMQFGVKYCGADGDTGFTFNEAFPNAYLTGQATFSFGVNTGSDGALAIFNGTQTGATLRNGSNWAGNVNWLVIGY